MKLGIVIPVGPGRGENLTECLRAIGEFAHDLAGIVLAGDGLTSAEVVEPLPPDVLPGGALVAALGLRKHAPGMEQPRNAGVRALRHHWPETTHVWFVDSDIVLEPWAFDAMRDALEEEIGGTIVDDRILVGPYDWMPESWRPSVPGPWANRRDLRNDPRWEMLRNNDSSHIFRGDLSAGLGCFSGNLVWPIEEFTRIGGFHPNLHHGRCEDGELGLRAVAMDVGISMVAEARGYHLWHPVDTVLALNRNLRDVPLLNSWHPWVEGDDVFMVDRDGKAFDRLCRQCGEMVPTILWWQHVADHGADPTP